MNLLLLVGLLGLGIALGLVLGRRVARRRAEAAGAATNALLTALRASATAEAGEIRRGAELTAREEAQTAGLAFEAVAIVRENEVVGRLAQVEVRRRSISSLETELATRRERLNVLRATQRTRDDEVRRSKAEVQRYRDERRTALESRAEQTATQMRAAIVEAESEQARIAGLQNLRLIEQTANDSEQARRATRVMGIAVGRFSGHYLTERLLSLVPPPPGIAVDHWVGKDEANLRAIEPIANVKLGLTEERTGVRLEGLTALDAKSHGAR